MHRGRMLLILTTLGTISPAARGQLVGPIPPATPPTPKYVAPAPSDPPVVAPPEVEPPAPSIVAHDETGNLKPLTGTPEQAAVAAYTFDNARRRKIAVSAAARQLDLDRFVITNLNKVLEARKMQQVVQTESEYAKLFQARELTTALRFERLIDRLERDGAITAAQRIRLDETLLAYGRARTQQIEKETGGDPTRTGVLNLRQTFADAMREPFDSLERQTADVAGHLAEVREALKLSPEQAESLTSLGDAPAPAAARRFVTETLSLEQQRAAMTARLADAVARTSRP